MKSHIQFPEIQPPQSRVKCVGIFSWYVLIVKLGYNNELRRKIKKKLITAVDLCYHPPLGPPETYICVI